MIEGQAIRGTIDGFGSSADFLGALKVPAITRANHTPQKSRPEAAYRTPWVIGKLTGRKGAENVVDLLYVAGSEPKICHVAGSIEYGFQIRCAFPRKKGSPNREAPPE